MNKMQTTLAYKNGKIKSFFEEETERLIREKYTEKDEKNILRNMLYDGDAVSRYLADLQEIRKNTKEMIEKAIGHPVDVGFESDMKTTGIFHSVKSVENATSIAFVTMAESGAIDDVTATEHASLFAEWAVGVDYKIGAIRAYGGRLYKCAQAHTSQTDWTPNLTASLWSPIGDPTEEFPAWSQPVGAHDAYMTGDKVTYDGVKWISAVDGNVWTPGVYGWEKVK